MTVAPLVCLFEEALLDLENLGFLQDDYIDGARSFRIAGGRRR